MAATPGSTERSHDLTSSVAAFCRVLRDEHDFGIGHHEAHDALRAIEALGISERHRFQSALRLVCCGTYAQTLAFDRAFDAFFDVARPGVPQAELAQRRPRPGREKPDTAAAARRNAPAQQAGDERDRCDGGSAQPRRPVNADADEAARWQLLRARYSPAAGRGTLLAIDTAALDEMRTAADRLVRTVRLGRSRRWKAMDRGSRFDIRRTLRASLETGGDPVALRFRGHPLRNPRFVVLIDGSRSMSDYHSAVITFAAALCDRSARANVLSFSTALRDVTPDLRALVRSGIQPADLGEAWGGGTKIAANLVRFVDEHGARLLSRETLVIICSDGLDVGDAPQLARTMRDIDRRCAGIVWLNPHAATPGFAPTARGMCAALPFITLLGAASSAAEFARLANHIGQTSRIHGRN